MHYLFLPYWCKQEFNFRGRTYTSALETKTLYSKRHVCAAVPTTMAQKKQEKVETLQRFSRCDLQI